MKTIEEKAKAYDEIIERAKTMLAAGEVMYGKENNASQLITDLIPDLKESEDERIRKEIIAFIEWSLERGSITTEQRIASQSWFAYLEKQEQKPVEKQDYSGLTDFERALHRGFLCAGVENVPRTIIKETAQDCLAHLPAEWSDKDKNIFNLALDLIKHSDDCSGILDQELAVKWFAELPSRFVPQPKQEWSEEDIEAFVKLYSDSLPMCGEFQSYHDALVHAYRQGVVNTLKSLRPYWKPSDKPVWRIWKNGACGNSEGNPIALVKTYGGYKLVSCLGADGEKYIMLSDLEKLPGFNEK